MLSLLRPTDIAITVIGWCLVNLYLVVSLKGEKDIYSSR